MATSTSNLFSAFSWTIYYIRNIASCRQNDIFISTKQRCIQAFCMCLERMEYNFVKDFVPKECYHEILEVKSMTLIAIKMESNNP